MGKVAIITEGQAHYLKGFLVISDCYFNPVKDADNNWVVSEEEINQSEIEWLKNLQLIDFKSPFNYELTAKDRIK